MNYILTCNAGSSSLKVKAYGVSGQKLTLALTMAVENIGQKTAQCYYAEHPKGGGKQFAIDVADHHAALKHIATNLQQRINATDTILAIGHRVVHGGQSYQKATIVSDRLLDDLGALQDLDPDHMPAALRCIEMLRESYPAATHVACFDTAFFTSLPPIAQRLPLPRKYHDLGLRRYGFHGLSYAYLLQDFAHIEGRTASHGRIIMAHLGSGASLCAVKDAKPIDTTMGFSPSGGIPMSTRSGDIDPGVVWFLHRKAGQSPQQFNTMANKESGLLGVSGDTGDMRVLLERQKTSPSAAQAVELFCYHTSKAIGALSATLGGLDSLIFSGGIGERSAEVRKRICANLEYLGIEIDVTRNSVSERLISRDGSPAGVHVIPTDESYMIANEVKHILQGGR